MGKKTKFFVYTLIFISLALLFTVGAALFTSRSSFCVSCHYMQPFYDSWKNSKHAKVECVECHFAPGIKNKIHGKMMGLVQLVKYATLVYKKSRPWAEISDESCLRNGCHETRLIQGKITFKEGVSFDHAAHLGTMSDGRKLRCTSCHSQIVQGSHMTVTESTCYLCHFKKKADARQNLGECVLCHTKELMEARLKQGLLRYDHTNVIKNQTACTNCHSHTVVGNGPVHKESCYNCHWDTKRLDKFKETGLLHEKHVSENKVECIRCHIPIEHKIHAAESESLAECQTCHPKHHDEKISLFTGTGGKGVASRPNRMMDIGFNCRACHISHGISIEGKNAKTFYASGKSCDVCHGKGYVKLIQNWRKDGDARIVELRAAAANVKRRAPSVSKESREIVLKLLEDADTNLRIVDKGNIVHNVRYANDLLTAARGFIEDAAKSARVDLRLPKQGLRADKLSNVGCLDCHFYLDKVAPEFASVKFSHKNHIERGLDCQRCHSIAQKHATLIIDKAGCAACHHKKSVTKKCEQCHALQNDVIQGRWDILDQPSMKSENFPCAECHKLKGSKVSPQDCANCHKKPEYADKMTKWTSDISKALDYIRSTATAAKGLKLTPGQTENLAKAEAFANGVLKDGSTGVHNPQAIKKAAKQYIKMLGEIPLPPK